MTDKPISFQSIEKQLSRLTSTTNNIIIPKEMQDFKLVGVNNLLTYERQINLKNNVISKAMFGEIISENDLDEHLKNQLL